MLRRHTGTSRALDTVANNFHCICKEHWEQPLVLCSRTGKRDPHHNTRQQTRSWMLSLSLKLFRVFPPKALIIQHPKCAQCSQDIEKDLPLSQSITIQIRHSQRRAGRKEGWQINRYAHIVTLWPLQACFPVSFLHKKSPSLDSLQTPIQWDQRGPRRRFSGMVFKALAFFEKAPLFQCQNTEW